MLDLLPAVQQQLQSTITTVPAADIILLEDEQLLPESLRYPAIGIKDGEVVWKAQTSRTYDQTLAIRVTVYVRLNRQGESVTGAGGVLALSAACRDALINNNLGLAGVYQAHPGTEEASETFDDGKELIQRRTITINYQRTKQV